MVNAQLDQSSRLLPTLPCLPTIHPPRRGRVWTNTPRSLTSFEARCLLEFAYKRPRFWLVASFLLFIPQHHNSPHPHEQTNLEPARTFTTTLFKRLSFLFSFFKQIYAVFFSTPRIMASIVQGDLQPGTYLKEDSDYATIHSKAKDRKDDSQIKAEFKPEIAHPEHKPRRCLVGTSVFVFRQDAQGHWCILLGPRKGSHGKGT